MPLTVEQHTSILALYERDLYRQAWQHAQALAPLEAWEGTEALLLAGRIAANVGGEALAQRLHTRAYRQARHNPEARRYYGRHLLTRFGPLVAWHWMRRTLDPLDDACQDPEWLSMAALVLAYLRDFERAELLCTRAAALSDAPWLAVERAQVLQQADRYPEALREAQRARETQPYFRPGVQCAAQLLLLLARDAEAEALLREASGVIESYAVDYQLALLYQEGRRWAELTAVLDRLEANAPLLSPGRKSWLSGLRSECAYFQGDLAEAIRLAECAGDGFHARMAERLKQAQAQQTPAQSVLLPVGFIRQHHMTCVPATLSALSQFFEKPAAHLEIVEEICYDGTPGHSERLWGLRNGYLSKEFTLTWEVARALLDRGLPFTLTTVATGSAHLQAVVGYDLRRRSLFLRDPYHRPILEALAEELIEQQAPTGPRAHLLLPIEKAECLEGIELPEAALWETYHALQVALMEHRRAAALAAQERLEEADPTHRLTLMARRSLAHYDGSATELLASTEALLERYPNEPNWQLARLAYLRDLSRQEERLAHLDTLCETDARNALVFWEMKAQELSSDFRRVAEVEALLRRVLRSRPTQASALQQLAGLRWRQRRWAESLELYRFASCLSDKSEHAAHAYFQALQWRGKPEAALAYLRRRFERLGGRSSSPAQTLYEALWAVDRHDEAQQVLIEAQERRPDDAELMLFAATALARQGRFDEARRWLERAKAGSSARRWLSAAANLAAQESDHERELALAYQLVEQDPLSVSAQRVIARVRSRNEGPEAAIGYLQTVAERFPCHLELNQLLEGWLRENHQGEAALAVLDRIRTAHPGDLWTQRERAVLLAWFLRQPESALTEIQEALRIHPNDPAAHTLLGAILQLLGRQAEAQEAWRTAIRLNADYGDAIRRLISSAEGRAARREALAFVTRELGRQPVQGESIPLLARLGSGSVVPEETLEALRSLHTARPDLWQTWDQLAEQQRALGHYPEAEAVIQGAIERFPLLPKLHITRGELLQEQGRFAEAKAALERALEIRPDSQLATRRLSELLLDTGEAAAAVAVLESGLRRNPQDDYLLQSLAHTLWTMGRVEEALVPLRQAILLDSDSTWPWERLREWSLAQGKVDGAIALARELLQRRPSEAHLWLRLAQLLPGEALDERLAALERALELSPRLVDAHDERARLLALAGRFDQARQACQPEGFAAVPRQLKARAAWVTAQSGDTPKALQEVQSLLETEPEFYWAWTLAAEWARDTDDFPSYERAAQRMTRLAPDQAVAWAYLGHAKRQTKDLPGAKDAFRRAHQLAPGYTYAGTSLLRLLAEDGEAEEIPALLAALLAAQPTDLWVRAQGVRALSKVGRKPEAQRELIALCCQPEVPGQDLHGPLQYCQKELEAQELDPALRLALTQPTVRPEVVRLVVQRLCSADQWDEARALVLGLQGRAALGPKALSFYAVALAEHHRPGVSAFVQEHATELSRDDLAWGNVAHVYETQEELDKTLAWTDDWRQRERPQPWMLLNRVDALRARNRDGEAAEVSRFALTLSPDYTTGWHALWLAFDAACAGKETTSLLAEQELTEQEGFYLLLAALVRTMEKARQKRGAGVLRPELVGGLGSNPNRPLRPFERRLIRRAGAVIFKTSPHGLVKLWCLWLRLAGAP